MPSKTTDRPRRGTTRPTTGHGSPPGGDSAFRAQQPEGKYAPTAWGSNTDSMGTDLVFPSGQVALVRRPGLQGLLKEGILHNLDTLTPFIEEHSAAANGRKPKAGPSVAEIMADPKAVDQLMHVLDRITTSCVVQPEIKMTPNDPTSRVAGVVYADQVDMDDKLFLFQFVVAGTPDLERFRKETATAVGSLSVSEEDGSNAS